MMLADQLIQAEKRLAEAHVTLDLAVIDDLLHPDYQIVQPDGTIQTKADVLADYQTGERVWTFASVDKMTINIVNQTAVIFGRWQAKGSNHGEFFDYSAWFMSVWVLEANGRYRNIAYQASELKP